MKPLDQYEVWFLTGSQELYGEATLRQVAADSEQIARSLGEAGGHPGPDRLPARPDLRRGDRDRDPGGQRGGRVRRRHRLDAHVLAGADVDRRPPRAPGPAPPPAHAVQPGPAVGGDRHGFHEPAPGRPWRPRVRVHPESPGDRPQDGRRPLGGSARPGSDRRVGAGRVRLARRAPHAGGPLRRQHASRRRHRGRQGRGADPARRDRQRLPVEPAHRCGGRGARCRGRRRGRGLRRRLRRRARTSTRWRPARRAARGGPDRGRVAVAADRRRFRCLHRHVRGPRRPAPAAGHRRPAVDGRRLRVRCRGRLEERGAGADLQGDGGRAAGRDLVHGGLHLPPRSRRAARPRCAHAGDLPEPGRRTAVLRDPPALDRWTVPIRSGSCSTPPRVPHWSRG